MNEAVANPVLTPEYKARIEKWVLALQAMHICNLCSDVFEEDSGALDRTLRWMDSPSAVVRAMACYLALDSCPNRTADATPHERAATGQVLDKLAVLERSDPAPLVRGIAGLVAHAIDGGGVCIKSPDPLMVFLTEQIDAAFRDLDGR